MIQVLLDTNVLVDFFEKRPGFFETAKEIIDSKNLGLNVASNTITDVYYLIARHHDHEFAKESIHKIISDCRILAVTEEDCREALNSAVEDYEDAVLDECAYRSGMEYVLTRDQAFADSQTHSNVILAKNFMKFL